MNESSFAEPAFSERFRARSVFEHRQAIAAIKLNFSLIPDEPEPLMCWRMRQMAWAIAFFYSGSYELSVIQAERAMIPVGEIPPSELSRVIRDALDEMQANLAMLRLAQFGL